MKKLIVITSLILPVLFAYSQSSIEYKNKIYKDNIKTVTLHQNGVKYGYPLLEFNSANQLVLGFDDLSESLTDYSYTLIHCDHNWTPSELNPIEYLKGFETDYINDFTNSFNTLIPYTRYTLYFPNENMDVLIPGNYILFVYEGFDKEKPVLTRQLYVVNNTMDIEAKVIRSSMVMEMDNSQELEINIKDKTNSVKNPTEDLSITILQNSSPNFSLRCDVPDFINGNTFQYKNSRKLSIKGGNEFRYFNTKNLKYVSEKINSVYFEKPYYRFELIPDGSRSYIPYSYSGDINGNFVITSDHNENFDTESEYVLVDFTYPSNVILNGSIYIYGALSDWEFPDNFKTEYDYTKKAYTKRLLLKQGFYNYQYVYYDNDLKTYSLDQTEGNKYETENEYLILVYYKPQGAQYEQIRGYKIVNTFKNL